jgi:hypothetical protein
MTEQEQYQEYEAKRKEHQYEIRRERFALKIYGILTQEEAAGEAFPDWKEIAERAVTAADALDNALYPDPHVLPPYEA